MKCNINCSEIYYQLLMIRLKSLPIAGSISISFLRRMLSGIALDINSSIDYKSKTLIKDYVYFKIAALNLNYSKSDSFYPLREHT